MGAESGRSKDDKKVDKEAQNKEFWDKFWQWTCIIGLPLVLTLPPLLNNIGDFSKKDSATIVPKQMIADPAKVADLETRIKASAKSRDELRQALTNLDSIKAGIVNVETSIKSLKNSDQSLNQEFFWKSVIIGGSSLLLVFAGCLNLSQIKKERRLLYLSLITTLIICIIVKRHGDFNRINESNQYIASYLESNNQFQQLVVFVNNEIEKTQNDLDYSNQQIINHTTEYDQHLISIGRPALTKDEIERLLAPNPWQSQFISLKAMVQPEIGIARARLDALKKEYKWLSYIRDSNIKDKKTDLKVSESFYVFLVALILALTILNYLSPKNKAR